MRPAPAGPTASCSTTGAPRSARKVARPTATTSAISSSGTSSSCSSIGGPTASLADLPSKNVDTGAGFERNLVLLQDVATVFETDALAPLVDVAQQLTGARYGADDSADVSLRIMADHARTVSFLVSDGVFPSNEGRGYVLRRLIRRAVRHAYRLGVEQLVTPELVDTTVELMGEAYPDLAKNATFVRDVIVREEERFRQTLKAGTNILSGRAREAPGRCGACRARSPSCCTTPTASRWSSPRRSRPSAGSTVDNDGFAAEMAEQKRRAKEARKRDGVGDDGDRYAELIEQFGPTEFTGRDEYESKARVLAVLDDPGDDVSIVLDRTPFYAESGGQIGDIGVITSDTGRAEVSQHALRRARAASPRGATRVRRDHTGSGGHGRDRRPASRRHPPEPHRHPPSALGPSPGARRSRQAAGFAGGTRSSPLRLQPLRADDGGRDPSGRGPGEHRRARQLSRPATTRPPRTTPNRSAPSPSSATSTATSCASSKPARTRPSCAAVRTSARWATSVR